jgi:transposase
MCRGGDFMARIYSASDELVSYANDITTNARLAVDAKKGLSVTLSAELGASVEETAKILGISTMTVMRYRQEMKRSFETGFFGTVENRGGRRNQLMTLEEENKFLDKWLSQALAGEVIDMAPIHNDLIEVVRHDVPISTTYRMLERHGWRKLAPDTKHPKSDPAAQEEFKKNSPKCWRPSRSKTKKGYQ